MLTRQGHKVVHDLTPKKRRRCPAAAHSGVMHVVVRKKPNKKNHHEGFEQEKNNNKRRVYVPGLVSVSCLAYSFSFLFLVVFFGGRQDLQICIIPLAMSVATDIGIVPCMKRLFPIVILPYTIYNLVGYDRDLDFLGELGGNGQSKSKPNEEKKRKKKKEKTKKSRRLLDPLPSTRSILSLYLIPRLCDASTPRLSDRDCDKMAGSKAKVAQGGERLVFASA